MCNQKDKQGICIRIIRTEVNYIGFELNTLLNVLEKVGEKLKELESKLREHDDKIVKIIQVINQLITQPEPPQKKIGFAID